MSRSGLCLADSLLCSNIARSRLCILGLQLNYEMHYHENKGMLSIYKHTGIIRKPNEIANKKEGEGMCMDSKIRK